MNTFFQFKNFTIHQDKCAMKVCTDACLFGAYVANKLEQDKLPIKNILDIGTGTGLLSLMLAQKVNTMIDAVELNEVAHMQAKGNIEVAPFKNINIHHADILAFSSKVKYDFIICNPPFFENQLKSANKERNAAMHATTLSYIQLTEVIKQNLSENGIAALLLPFYALQDFTKILSAEYLFINDQINVKHNPTKPFFRAMLRISLKKTTINLEEISIKNKDGQYADEFVNLLKDYYLNF